MQKVPQAFLAPGHCAVIPGRTGDPEGFIDTHNDVDSPQLLRTYVSAQGVRELLKTLGWPTPEEHEELLARVAHAEEVSREAWERAERAEAALDHIDGLTKHDLVIRKRPGRPAQPKAYPAGMQKGSGLKDPKALRREVMSEEEAAEWEAEHDLRGKHPQETIR